MSNLIGQSLGRYEIKSLLGDGNMGVVFKGYDPQLKRPVAIKVIHSNLARRSEFRERFLQEARATAQLSHPGIVEVYDYDADQENDLPYIVMKFIPGQNLQQKLDDLRNDNQWMSLNEGIQLIRDVCSALHYAHDKGVLHRDIKPANIMLQFGSRESPPYQPVVMDLGLAKLLEGGFESQEGTVIGTPAYMSPEQAEGQKIDARSDLYSLGMILYELIVGQYPFPVETPAEAILSHTQKVPSPPRSLRPDLPESFEQLILKALQKNPDDRFPNAAAMAKALNDVHLGISAPTSNPRDTLTPTSRGIYRKYQKSVQVIRSWPTKIGGFIQENPIAIITIVLTILLSIGTLWLWLRNISYVYPGPFWAALGLAAFVFIVGLVLNNLHVSNRQMSKQVEALRTTLSLLQQDTLTFMPKVNGLKILVKRWQEFRPESAIMYSQLQSTLRVFAKLHIKEITFIKSFPVHKRQGGVFLVKQGNGNLRVLKFDSVKNIREEYASFTNYVKIYTDHAGGEALFSWPPKADLDSSNVQNGAIVYKYAHLGSDDPQTFEEYYQTKDTKAVKEVLEAIPFK